MILPKLLSKKDSLINYTSLMSEVHIFQTSFCSKFFLKESEGKNSFIQLSKARTHEETLPLYYNAR